MKGSLMKFVNINEASKILCCSTRTIHNRILDGKIKTTRDGFGSGSPYFFLIKDLYAYRIFGIPQYIKLTRPQKTEIKEILE
ncbi:MAG: hypothetical protein HOJ14_05255 [Nitrospina sp.]|jgi:hypothetical protein|nr:hypothetical protein [Nitrospina sp.]